MDVDVSQLHHDVDIDPVSPDVLAKQQSADGVIGPIYLGVGGIGSYLQISVGTIFIPRY